MSISKDKYRLVQNGKRRGVIKNAVQNKNTTMVSGSLCCANNCARYFFSNRLDKRHRMRCRNILYNDICVVQYSNGSLFYVKRL